MYFKRDLCVCISKETCVYVFQKRTFCMYCKRNLFYDYERKKFYVSNSKETDVYFVQKRPMCMYCKRDQFYDF